MGRSLSKHASLALGSAPKRPPREQQYHRRANMCAPSVKTKNSLTNGLTEQVHAIVAPSFGQVGKLPVKLGIFSILGHKLAVRALLDDPPLVDHENAVGLHDRAQAMRDDESRAARPQLFQRFLHEHLRGSIDGAG